MLDYIKLAKDDLREYKRMKMGIAHNEERIEVLSDQATSLKSGMSDSTPVKGGTSHAEDKLINNIVLRDRLSMSNEATEKLVRMIDESLATLDDTERKVLERMYINCERGAVDRLCEEMGYEKSRIYQIKDDALHKFTISMYAVIGL